jgi:hypothetical protein
MRNRNHASIPVSVLILLLIAPLTGIIDVGAVNLDYGMGSYFGNGDYFLSEDSYDQMGTGVAIVQDLTGDNRAEVVIGASQSLIGGTDSGKVYLVSGSKFARGGISLDGGYDEDASLYGNQYEAVGYGIADLGDVNGDGLGDFLVGAPGYGHWERSSGTAYLVLGDMLHLSKDKELASEYIVKYAGVTSWSETGADVRSAGDFDGDGIKDFLIGAPGYPTKAPDYAGAAYLVYGVKVKDAKSWGEYKSVNAADLIIASKEAGSETGYQVSKAGDINGDGYDDIMISAPLSNSGCLGCGKIAIFFGGPQRRTGTIDISKADVTIYGDISFLHLGETTAAAGDVNGDGFDDIIFGDWDSCGISYAGCAGVIFGHGGAWKSGKVSSFLGASYLGEQSGDDAGLSLAGAGDVNGDGFNDFLIGAPLNDHFQQDGGRTYLVLGKASGWTKNQSLGAVDAAWAQNEMNSLSGYAVAGGHDLDGDFLDDIIIGKPWMNTWVATFSGASVIFPARNHKPNVVGSVDVYTDPAMTKKADYVSKDTQLYIRAMGTDNSPTTVDVTQVVVYNNKTDDNIEVRLMETGPNTGIFTGLLRPMNVTNENRHWMRALGYTRVTVQSDQNPTAKADFRVGAEISPAKDTTTVLEDSTYNIQYQVFGGDSSWTWTLFSNASWLGLGAKNGTLQGIPTNANVGTYSVMLRACGDTTGICDYRTFKLEVKNTPPKILTKDITSVLEDSRYLVTYTSSDDGQGDITWNFTSNATWLSWGAQNQTVYGTPRNADGGNYSVKISVDDGHKGTEKRSFVLRVNNTNDPPVITTPDVLTATEDIQYQVNYKAVDPDPTNDVLTWNLTTDAKWLSLTKWGSLWGTPRNDDVGVWAVQVTVSDPGMLKDVRRFNITVLNVNDPPVITSTPVDYAVLGTTYRYNMTALDIDKGDVLTYSIVSGPTDAKMDPRWGRLIWTPAKTQKGPFEIMVSVTDGNVTILQGFKVFVNGPPRITSTPVLKAGANMPYTYQVVAQDPNQEPLTYKLMEHPLGMTLSAGGLLRYTPTMYQVGIQHIRISVSDGQLEDIQSIDLQVTADPYPFNEPPSIGPIGDKNVKIGDDVVVIVKATDNDGDRLAYTIVNPPYGSFIDDNGSLFWRPTKGQEGRNNITVWVSDGKEPSTVTFWVSVKGSPPPKNDDVQRMRNEYLAGISVMFIIGGVLMALGAMFGLRARKKGTETEAPAVEQTAPQVAQAPPTQPPGEQYQWDPATGQWYDPSQAAYYPPVEQEQQAYAQAPPQTEPQVEQPVVDQTPPQYKVEVVDLDEPTKEAKPEKGKDEGIPKGGEK